MPYIFIFLLMVGFSTQGLSQRGRKIERKALRQLEKGDTNGALERINSAIEKNITYTRLYLLRGRLKEYRGDLGPAMADYNTYCTLKPDCGEGLLDKARVLMKQGNFPAAIAQAKLYLVGDEGNEVAWMTIGQAHFNQKEYAEAIEAYAHVASRVNQLVSKYNTGLAHYHLQDYDKAVVTFNELKASYPTDMDVLFMYGLSLDRLGRYNESTSAFSELLLMQPKNASAFFNRGNGYYFLGLHEKACDDWLSANRIGHPNAFVTHKKYCE